MRRAPGGARGGAARRARGAGLRERGAGRRERGARGAARGANQAIKPVKPSCLGPLCSYFESCC